MSSDAGGMIIRHNISLKSKKTLLTTSGEEKVVPTCCNMCGGQTGVLVYVIGGRVVKIEPNPDNPIGVSNVSSDYWAHRDQVAMCPKGNSAIMALYDPDRVTKPLKRTNPDKGKGVDPGWNEISWEEAIDEIAGKLTALMDAGEEHTLIWFSEDHSFVNIQRDFCNLFGTPNYHNHSNLCSSSRSASFRLVMGHPKPLPDVANSRYILFFGWNALGAVNRSYFPRILTKGIENGAKFVVVDPFFSYTASKAHEWIPIRPGTDGAMALAMGHTIIKEKLYDDDFIENWTAGFDKYRAYVRDKTPQWAEEICDVPADTIRRIAIEFATQKPSLVNFRSGVHQHSNSVQAGRAIALLNVLIGQIDKPGTLIIPKQNGNVHQPVKYKKIEQPPLDGRGTKYPYNDGSGIYCETFSRILDERGPYMPKIGVIIFQNPVMAVPNTENAIKALKKLEYLVVIDTHLSETAELADIVLPGTTFLERYNLNTQRVTWSVVALTQPVVNPIFGQLPEYEFIIALGKKLKLKDADGRLFFENLNYEEYLSKELENGGPRITLTELKALPGATWIDPKGTEYEKFKQEVKMPIMVLGNPLINKEGVIKDKHGKDIGVKIGSKIYKGFNTPSRKLEFYSKELIGKKDANGNPIDPLPVYYPRDWVPNEEYPMYLINWKDIHHCHSRTQNNPWLMELQSWNPLWINVATAEKLGIRDGDWVYVESPYSKDKAKIKLTEGMHPEVVGWQHGFGHWGFGKIAKGKGTNDGQFNLTKVDPISGMALHKEVCVKIYKA